MAYDENLEERIDNVLKRQKVDYVSKKMMGGLCYMVDDKMCVGIVRDQLMARIAPEIYETSLKLKGCSEMKFTGKPMNGYVFVDLQVIDNDKDLEYWVNLCLEFNPQATSSKKKKAK